MVHRRDITEVGNLSATDASATRWLILAVILLLHREDCRCIAFTATNVVRNGLRRLGLQAHALGTATPERLPQHEHGQWGNYYLHAPLVMAGEIAHGYQSLLANGGIFKLLGSRLDAPTVGGAA